MQPDGSVQPGQSSSAERFPRPSGWRCLEVHERPKRNPADSRRGRGDADIGRLVHHMPPAHQVRRTVIQVRQSTTGEAELAQSSPRSVARGRQVNMELARIRYS